MIETWSTGDAGACMPEEMLVETLAKARRHPWHAARGRLTAQLLRAAGIIPPATLLEVGCGWGQNLDLLEKAGFRISGMDISPQVLAKIDKTGRRLIEADLLQPFPENVALNDAILALDVIEHLDDDIGAVRQISKLLKPGGIAIVSVPALPELYSDFDAIQGHRRRYIPETLRAAIEGGGLKIDRLFWWGAWMVPIIRRTRKSAGEKSGRKPKTYAEYLSLPPWPAPLLFKLAFSMEESRAIAGRLRTGTSLFAVAQRP